MASLHWVVFQSIFLIAALVISGCTSKQPEGRAVRPHVAKHRAGPPVSGGRASWYGPGFEGRKTASGETFKSGDLTAGHRSLPLGTRVEVTHVRSGRKVRVRINDRGPYVKGRVIDLSRAAAERLGLVGTGVAPVTIKVLSKPKAHYHKHRR